MEFFILVLVVLLTYQNNADGYYDLIEESGCDDTEFRLACKSFTAKIVIFHVEFSPRKSDFSENSSNVSLCEKRKVRSVNCERCFGSKSCENENVFPSIKTASNSMVGSEFRQTINRRCSGVNYCSFLFREDFHGAKELDPGDIIIRYACIEDANVTRSCNVELKVMQEGLVRSPGYPSFYVGDTICHWTLKASLFQRIKLTFLDLSLRSVGPYESDCLDWISVSENGLSLIKTCGELTDHVIVYSQGPTLNVTLVANSKTLFPKRGLLFHYKTIGCPFVKKPEDGYLVDRNDTFVHYRCCVGFVFPDTLSRDKVLMCHDENTWSGQILDCVSIDSLHQDKIKLIILDERSGVNFTASVISKMEAADSVKDIILPSIIIVAMFIGNAVILYVIYRQRKKLALNAEKIELTDLSKPATKHVNC